MTDEPCTHGCQCDFCREDEPETKEMETAIGKLIWDAVGYANSEPEEPDILNRLLDGSPRPLPQLDLLKMTVADQEWHWRHENSEMSGAVLARYYSMTHAHCTQCSCGFCKTWGPPGTMHKPDCECMECDYRVTGLAKMRDDVRAEAQEAGETSEQPLAVCWAYAKGSPLWRDPRPLVAAGPALAAGADPIKVMDEYAKRTEQAAGQALNNQQGRTYQGSGLGHVDPLAQQRTPQGGTILGLDQAGLQALQDDLNKAQAGPLVPYPGPVFAPLPQHPSEVQMLTDDLIAVTRERDAAIAEMGRLEKERDEALATHKLRAEFWTEECNKWANRRDTFEAEQASLRLQIVDLRRERDVASLALVAMKRSYRELEARVAGTVPPPVPDIPLRALGSTHAATGLKMGERG